MSETLETEVQEELSDEDELWILAEAFKRYIEDLMKIEANFAYLWALHHRRESDE